MEKMLSKIFVILIVLRKIIYWFNLIDEKDLELNFYDVINSYEVIFFKG